MTRVFAVLMLAGAALAAPPTSRHARKPRPMPMQRLDAGTVADQDGCSADKDCILLRTPAGSCCETLCSPRAVLKTDAKWIRDQEMCKHANLSKCAIPNCAPPRGEPQAVCRKNRCVIELLSTD